MYEAKTNSFAEKQIEFFNNQLLPLYSTLVVSLTYTLGSLLSKKILA